MEGFGQKKFKKIHSEQPQVAFFLVGRAILAISKIVLELWSPNTSRYKKNYEIKKFPFDEIYLECGLRFEIKPLFKALEPKNYIFKYRHDLAKLKK